MSLNKTLNKYHCYIATWHTARIILCYMSHIVNRYMAHHTNHTLLHVARIHAQKKSCWIFRSMIQLW